MRYRALSSTGDMQFGRGQANFLINSPATVAQAILTRMRLFLGEWFIDLTQGMPWLQQVIGFRQNYDQAIRLQIMQTQGVVGIGAYTSSVTGRALSVTVTAVQTVYGVIPQLTINIPLAGG